MNNDKLHQPSDLSLVTDALHAALGEDQQRIALAGIEWIALLIRKNMDYGSSVWKPPILDHTMPAKSAILVRMSDKIERIRHLMGSPGSLQVIDESLEDTMKDLGAYALLYCACPKDRI